MALDINGYNATFKAFTDFATKSVSPGRRILMPKMRVGRGCRRLYGRQPEARMLAEATSSRTRIQKEINDLTIKMALAKTTAERLEYQAQIDQKVDEIHALEREQTANVSDAGIIDLVENTIRARPEDFPLLTKYYLNGE